MAYRRRPRHSTARARAIIFSVIAGSSLLSRSQQLELIAGILSISVSIIVSISTLLNPGKLSEEYFNAGTIYLELKDDVQFFYEVESMRGDKNYDQLISELSKISNKRDELGKKCPRIPKERFKEGVEYSVAEIKRAGIKPPQTARAI